MSIQQFCLRWNNHQPNFISVFTTLLNTESLVDVTLAAEGRHLQAHKVVLSACSVYFQTLFTENPSRHPIVILKDVKYSDLRIMVDFMYYGEVNVSQEQLPQVLETAKMLKIKGLTEMPESTSLTRSQGTMSEFLSPGDEVCMAASPNNSPTPNKKKKYRPSNGNNHGSEERQEGAAGVELGRGDAITLSSLPQRRRDYLDDAPADSAHQLQTEETHNNIHSDDPLMMETNPPGLSQEYSGASISQRRRLFQRQARLRRLSIDPPLRKHVSLPLPSTSKTISVAPVATAGPSQPTLQKFSSHPPMTQSKTKRLKTEEADSVAAEKTEEPPRASHTPAMRAGPPLSCNFCWNTVDLCGRILRRKTQYHCPECRTNLCIVPCFHEYHDSTADEPS